MLVGTEQSRAGCGGEAPHSFIVARDSGGFAGSRRSDGKPLEVRNDEPGLGCRYAPPRPRADLLSWIAWLRFDLAYLQDVPLGMG